MVLKKPLSLVLTVDDFDRPLTNLVNEASVKVSLMPSLDFLALMDKHEFTQRGRLSWAIYAPNNADKISGFLLDYAETFLPNTLVSSMEAFRDYNVSSEPANYYDESCPQNALANHTALRQALNAIPAFHLGRFRKLAEPLRVQHAYYNQYNQRGARNQRQDTPMDRKNKYTTLGGVALELSNDMFWVRLFPVENLAPFADRIHMPKVRNVRTSKETYFPPRKVNTLLNTIENTWGDMILDERSDKVVELLEKAKEVVTVGYAPNEPATVVFTKGENVKNLRGNALLNAYRPGEEKTMALTRALKIQEETKGVDFLIHPALTDIVKMVKARPYTGDPRLKDYQRVAVGLHLATEIGYLQSCSPGMGKTFIQLAAMKAKADKVENYRGLVVCEANVRQQWVEEAEKWWPEVKTVVIETNKDVDVLAEALAETKPVIVILSYAHTLLAYEEREKREAEAKRVANLTFMDRIAYFRNAPMPELTLGGMILDGLWEDICADEAVIIRNGTSKQANIMWTLRKNSKVATALTATPINKSPDDIARLLSWVRNDRNLFTGVPLSEQYDTTTVEGAKKLFKIFGPLVFRRDTSEIADEMPNVKQKVFLLKPSAAEKALASAAEKELKRCYLELVAALEEVEKAGTADKEELKKVKENLRKANGAWLGGTQLARMATSDPTALLQSDSVGAALLSGQGLIAEAMKKEPTKRAKFISETQKRVLAGQQVIVFTEFATVANTLVKALQDNGINAKAYTGKNGSTRDRARKEFQDGKLDVLVCTQAAERGLTLHRAAAIYHYDLPWTLEKIIQRTGRGVRIGSKNEVVDVVFMVMEGTVEQRIANHLVNLGMSASLVLDYSRGVELKNTETATAMAGLMTTMAKKGDNQNLKDFGKILLGEAA